MRHFSHLPNRFPVARGLLAVTALLFLAGCGDSGEGAASTPVAGVTPQAVEVPEVVGVQDSADNSDFPYFELQTLSGESWALADYEGQPKLIMFWATWCPYCKKIFPTIQAIHEVHQPNLKVAAISVRDDGDVAAYVEKRGLTMDILVEGDAVAELYKVPGTPAILLLDGENNIVFGTLDSDPNDPSLRIAVDELMAQMSTPSNAPEQTEAEA